MLVIIFFLLTVICFKKGVPIYTGIILELYWIKYECPVIRQSKTAEGAYICIQSIFRLRECESKTSTFTWTDTGQFLAL